MEFITAEQFLKQPIEVRKIFTDWQNENLTKYDLIWWNNKIDLYLKYIDRPKEEHGEYSFMLFTEGQLRQFIEDKIKTKLRIIPTNIGYRIIYLPGKGTDLIDKCYEGDLLQAYWKVAIEIAKEVTNND